MWLIIIIKICVLRWNNLSCNHIYITLNAFKCVVCKIVACIKYKIILFLKSTQYLFIIFAMKLKQHLMFWKYRSFLSSIRTQPFRVKRYLFTDRWRHVFKRLQWELLAKVRHPLFAGSRVPHHQVLSYHVSIDQQPKLSRCACIIL